MGSAPGTTSGRRCVVCHARYAASERFCPLDGGAIVDIDVDAGDPLIGQTIDGRYLVRRLLGRGGMGSVYEAHHVGLDKRVAIKFLLHDNDREASARFRREARVASRVSHEHIVKVFDVGSAGDRDYLVMDYLEGRDLRCVLEQEGALAPARAAAIARQLLLGLQVIHDAGLVHRDIKPANLWLASDRDFVTIMDFGISKTVTAGDDTVTGTNKVVGTPQFMAPEQLLDGEVDHRADLYAAGLVLYAMLAGEAPFTATAYSKVAAMHLGERPPSLAARKPELPRALVDAVERALEKSPASRFANAREFVAALDGDAPQARAEVATVAERPARPSTKDAPPPLPPEPTQVVGRRRWIAHATLAAFVAIAALGVAFFAQRDRGQQPVATPATPVPARDAATMAQPVPTPSDRDAGAPGNAAVEVDAGTVAAVTIAPSRPPRSGGGTRRACRCLDDDGQLLCKKTTTSPLCLCMSALNDGNDVVCPTPFIPCGKDGCPERGWVDLPNMKWRCPEPNYAAPYLRATPGASCSGYLTSDLTTTANTYNPPTHHGVYECDYCVRAIDETIDQVNKHFEFDGEPGQPCTGQVRNSGAVRVGHMRCGSGTP